MCLDQEQGRRFGKPAFPYSTPSPFAMPSVSTQMPNSRPQPMCQNPQTAYSLSPCFCLGLANPSL